MFISYEKKMEHWVVQLGEKRSLAPGKFIPTDDVVGVTMEADHMMRTLMRCPVQSANPTADPFPCGCFVSHLANKGYICVSMPFFPFDS